MKIIITESQYKKIILESSEKNLDNKLNSLKDFFVGIIKEAKKQVGLDLGFLLTWGTTIAGFVNPVQEYIKGEFPELTNTDLALLTTGIILTYFTSNKEMLGKTLKKIKENGLVFEFDGMLKISNKLKNVFLSFIDSLGIPISKIGNMMAYTFLIPIIPELYEFAQGAGDFKLNEIVTRIVLFLGISGSTIFLKRLIQEIVRRFKS